MSDLKVGDEVRYREVKDDKDFTQHFVRSVHLHGIPSCALPMVKLSDKAGLVLASHCEKVEEKSQ